MSSREVSRAILKSDIKSLQELLNNGFDPTEVVHPDEWNLLHRALVPVPSEKQASVEMLEYLISKNVEVNAKDRYLNTPLHYASRTKNVEAINLLIAHGAEIDIENKDGLTPLKLTLSDMPFNAVATEALLKGGANPNKAGAGKSVPVKELAKVICHGENSYIIDIINKY